MIPAAVRSRPALSSTTIAVLLLAAASLASCSGGTPTAARSPTPSRPVSAPVTATPGATPSPSPTAGTTAPRPSSTPHASPPPGVTIITQADEGGRFTLRVGATAQLRLSGLSWSPPQTSGPSVSVAPVTFLRDPGYQAWTLRAVSPGTARIRATGGPVCPPGSACPQFIQLLSITIVVTP